MWNIERHCDNSSDQVFLYLDKPEALRACQCCALFPAKCRPVRSDSEAAKDECMYAYSGEIDTAELTIGSSYLGCNFSWDQTLGDISTTASFSTNIFSYMMPALKWPDSQMAHKVVPQWPQVHLHFRRSPTVTRTVPHQHKCCPALNPTPWWCTIITVAVIYYKQTSVPLCMYLFIVTMR